MRLNFFCYLSIFFICFFSSVNAQERRVLKVASQFGAEIYIPLIKEVYFQLGYSIEITTLPSERALFETNKGNYDAEIGRTLIASGLHPNIVPTHECLIDAKMYGWVLKGSTLSIQSVTDLKKYRVGTLNGLKTIQLFCDSLHLNYDSPSTLSGLIKMLQLKRIDIVVFSDVLFSEHLDSVAVKLPLTLGSYKIYHIFNKKNSDLVHMWDTALKRIKTSGRYDELLETGKFQSSIKNPKHKSMFDY